MTEPRIQYAKTTDGVSIAHYRIGEGNGMPLVWVSTLGLSHLQLQWQVPEIRRFAERLAEKRTWVTYDARGSGLSDREVTDISLEAWLMDLEAVVDHLGIERFALLGNGTGGLPALAYAARHPDRVSQLLLWCAFTRGSDYMQRPGIQTAFRIAETDWETFTETASHMAWGWSEGEVAHRMAAYIRECITAEVFQTFVRVLGTTDLTALLAEIRSPTLVLHRRQHPFVDVAMAKGLASGIPDARLVLLEGSSDQPYLEDSEAVLAVIDEFLGEGEEAGAGIELPEPGAFRTILFTDVEGSTALTDRLGDTKARDLLREHERIVREALKAHGGSEVKTMGDGFMTSFSSATRALECAITVQRAFAERNESAGEPILVRIGLNAGEPIAEDDDLFGASVNRAARIAAMAQGGEILVANVVRELAEGKEFMFGDRGETALRGFDDPVRLFEVRWQE